MSAYVVDPETIHLMLYAGMRSRLDHVRWQQFHGDDGIQRRELHEDSASTVGDMLLRECIRSVSHRYPQDTLDTLPGPSDVDLAAAYEYPRAFYPQVPDDMLPIVALKSIDCYEYQSCETEDWEQSEAYRFCTALRRHLIHELPGYAIRADMGGSLALRWAMRTMG